MPAKRLEVTEIEIGADEADVAQEMVAELHEMMPGAPCLDSLPP
jgi:hypothetical protein